MKKTLNLTCPHCQLKAELRIEEEAEMILMRCVSCDSPYLYFHGETFEVNEDEMDHLRSAEMKEVEGLLKFDDEEEEVQTVQQLHDSLPELPEKDTSMEGSDKRAALQKHIDQLKQGVIQKDEILNLKIDLETTGDVLDFIARIEAA